MKKIARRRKRKLKIFFRTIVICLLLYTCVMVSIFLVSNVMQFSEKAQPVSNMDTSENVNKTPITANFKLNPTLYKCDLNNPFHILVNNEILLDENYAPVQLYKPNVKFATDADVDKNYMEYEAGKALEKLFEQAKLEGIQLIAVSGYRSYERQVQLYNAAIEKDGADQINTAKPGSSEHQTGLAMDINMLEERFAQTAEGKWAEENAHKFGFIIRYPKDKVHITEITYEPWHLRYAGEELATFCYENNLTLEELDKCCRE